MCEKCLSVKQNECVCRRKLGHVAILTTTMGKVQHCKQNHLSVWLVKPSGKNVLKSVETTAAQQQ